MIREMFWYGMLLVAISSLIAYAWANALGIVEVPWYKDIGVIIAHVLGALVALVGISNLPSHKKKEE